MPLIANVLQNFVHRKHSIAWVAAVCLSPEIVLYCQISCNRLHEAVNTLVELPFCVERCFRSLRCLNTVGTLIQCEGHVNTMLPDHLGEMSLRSTDSWHAFLHVS
jgi:hypothetical protein